MPKIRSAHSKTEKENSSPLAQDTRDHTGKASPSGSRPSFSLSSRARRTTSRSSASAPRPHSQTKKSSYAGAGGLPPCTEPSPLPPLADSRYSLGATHTEPENRLSLRQDHVPFSSRRRPAGSIPAVWPVPGSAHSASAVSGFSPLLSWETPPHLLRVPDGSEEVNHASFPFPQPRVAFAHCKHRNTRELYRRKSCVARALRKYEEVRRSPQQSLKGKYKGKQEPPI